MADQPISGLGTYPASPTSATGTSADEIEFLDVNDTSMASTGTNKRVNMADFFSTFITAGSNITVTKQTSGGGVSIAGSAGGVTSISFTGDGTIFTASACTAITTSGTLTPGTGGAGLIAQTKNTFFAGPTTGSNAAPTFRAIGASDVPNQLTIGNAVSGGGVNQVLFEDGSSNLAASANLLVSSAIPRVLSEIDFYDSTNTYKSGSIMTGGGYALTIATVSNGALALYSTGACQIQSKSATYGVQILGGSYSVPACNIVGAASQTAPLLYLQNLSSTSTARNCGIIDATFNTSTDASWSGNLLLYAGDYTSTNAGKRLGVQIQSDGTQALLGFYGATPVAKPTGDIGTALTNLGLATTPATSTITVDTPSAGAVTCNLATSNWHQITFAANTTITLSNVGTNQQFTLIIIQGGSGSYTATFSGMTIKWPNGIVPILTTTVGGIDVLTFKQISAGNYYGFVAGQALA